MLPYRYHGNHAGWFRSEASDCPDSGTTCSLRVGDFACHIPVNPGRYAVTLTFVEPDAAPGARIFDVTANGADAAPQRDISLRNGGDSFTNREPCPQGQTKGRK